MPIAAKKAAKILTISNFAGQEIAQWFPNQNKKVKVIYLGVEPESNTLTQEEKAAFFRENGIKEPFILGFGSLEQRKNSLRLVESYNRLPNHLKEKYQLVLFGFRGYLQSEDKTYIESNGLSERVIVLEYISDQKKATLYSSSSAFVFPTLAEGFGIPVLEAFAGETPVITSNVTSIPEVAGNAAVLVNPLSVDEISTELNALLESPQKAKQMVENGKKQLSKFDWNKTAQQIFAELIG